MRLIFIELPLFTSLITQITDDSYLNKLQHDLLKDPEKGDLIPRLHGLRKVRMAIQGKGRQGGARVIYLNLPPASGHHFLLRLHESQIRESDAGAGAPAPRRRRSHQTRI